MVNRPGDGSNIAFGAPPVPVKAASGAEPAASRLRSASGRRKGALELLAPGAGESHARAAFEPQLAVAVEQRSDLAHTLEIHDRRAVHAKEARGIEALPQLVQGFAQQVRLPRDMDLG